MRYLMMHKADRHSEAGVPPTPALVAGMGRLIGDMIKTGIFLDAGGLHRSARRVRVSVADGKASVSKGPFPGQHEVLADVLALKVKDLDEAIEWTRRYGLAFGRAELEIGPMVEAWDMGAPRPEGEVPLRCLVLHKATADTEAGKPWSKQVQADLSALLAEMRQRDVLLFREVLLPSATGARLQYRDGVRTVIDGPFAESKELFGGFIMLQLRSLDEGMEWANRFAQVFTGSGVHDALELDFRSIDEGAG